MSNYILGELFYSKKNRQKKSNTKKNKTKQKTKQISQTNHCQTMDYRTNRQRLRNVEAYNNKLAVFSKSKKHPIVKEMLHNRIYPLKPANEVPTVYKLEMG
jgi:hypothetical protein